MHCPACHAENAAGAAHCVACGGPLTPVPATTPDSGTARRSSGSKRRVPTEEETALAEPWEGTGTASLRAYRVALLALVPGLGLFLGPLAVLMGYLAGHRCQGEARGRNQARVAIVIGLLVALTQWVGVLLMIHAWPLQK